MRNKENKVSLVERQGIWYEINSQEPFTGVGEQYYEDGQLRTSANYIAGELDGLAELYFENGQLQLRENYIAGELISFECWNEQGLPTTDCF